MNTSSKQAPTHIVVIGASAGSLDALQCFFTAFPSDTGIACVVVQHLAPSHNSIMDEILARYTRIPVKTVSDGMRLERDSIYLMPANAEMRYQDGALRISPRPEQELSLPIDIFLNSLVLEHTENLIAIILSGTGSDGTVGVRAVRAEGGLVLCQNPETAAFDGMPTSAIATGAVDCILEPGDMPALIIDYIQHPVSLPDSPDDDSLVTGDAIEHILEVLRHRFSVNFRQYKPGTINRRIERRIAILGIEYIKDYCERFIHDRDEQQALYLDLLIGVTEFFRNPESWQLLALKVLPDLCRQVSPERELRVWVPGCATGEEAYTMAILIQEELENQGKPNNVRIFATDINSESLKTASQGRYSYSSFNNMDRHLLGKHFNQRDDFYFEVAPELRKMVVIARQNLLSEPPFTNIDLVSCRNVLIYFSPDAYRAALRAFHFSLRLHGYLSLGPSETISEYANEFDAVEQGMRLFKKIHNSHLLLQRGNYQLPTNTRIIDKPATQSTVATPKRPTGLLIRTPELIRAYDKVLEQFVPCSVLVDESGNLIHSFGDASRFLSVPEGFNSTDITRLIHPDLRMAVSTGLMRARHERQPVSYQSVQVSLSDAEQLTLHITVEHLGGHHDDGHFLIHLHQQQATPVTIDTTASQGAAQTTDLSSAPMQNASLDLAKDQVSQLELELHSTRETLQSTVEELESSHIELQGTNEELMASNEELQSTNEELHSLNEELHTLNQEYEDKINQLSELTSDMDNLLNCTGIGTIFLDREFNIRKFTPAAATIFNLMAHDVGRPIEHLRRNFHVSDFAELLNLANQSDHHLEREIRDNEGNYLIMGLHPFINSAQQQDGIILTFVDVNSIKEQEFLRLKHEKLQDYAYAVSHDMKEPLRNVETAVEMLFETVTMDQEQQELAQVLRDSVHRLSSMHQGMLEYSRIETRGKTLQNCELDTIAARAVHRLGQLIDTSHARVSVEPMPSISCDEKQLQLIFEELITNAIRFNRNNEPEIRISYLNQENFDVIAFADNGIGIDPDKVDDIYRIFSRLNKREDFAGLGLGLALVERIMQRHDGLVACEPNPDGGTIFKLSFPKSISDPGSQT